MRRFSLACAAVWLGAAAPVLGGDIHTIRFLDRGRARLGIVGGEPRVVATGAGDYDWDLARGKAKPTTISVIKPRRWGGYYLAYDPEGKGKARGAVFLSEKAGDGAKWLLERVKGDDGDTYAVRAASGKVKGWYLEAEPEGERFTDEDGKEATCHRLRLAEKPRRTPRVDVTVIAP